MKQGVTPPPLPHVQPEASSITIKISFLFTTPTKNYFNGPQHRDTFLRIKILTTQFYLTENLFWFAFVLCIYDPRIFILLKMNEKYPKMQLHDQKDTRGLKTGLLCVITFTNNEKLKKTKK